jgi:DNA repair exonuclease SbcCD ATPase subunit
MSEDKDTTPIEFRLTPMSWAEVKKRNQRLTSKRWHKANKERHKANCKAYEEANKEAMTAKRKAWYEANKERIRAQHKAYYEATKGLTREAKRDWTFRYKYGISLQERDAMIEAQGGRCAVCGAKFGDTKADYPSVDHCHSSGRIRGILCANCNIALGLAHDDPKILRALADYLEQ